MRDKRSLAKSTNNMKQNLKERKKRQGSEDERRKETLIGEENSPDLTSAEGKGQ